MSEDNQDWSDGDREFGDFPPIHNSGRHSFGKFSYESGTQGDSSRLSFGGDIAYSPPVVFGVNPGEGTPPLFLVFLFSSLLQFISFVSFLLSLFLYTSPSIFSVPRESI